MAVFRQRAKASIDDLRREELAALIRTKRAKANLSQSQIGQRAGVSQTLVSFAERGKSTRLSVYMAVIGALILPRPRSAYAPTRTARPTRTPRLAPADLVALSLPAA